MLIQPNSIDSTRFFCWYVVSSGSKWIFNPYKLVVRPVNIGHKPTYLRLLQLPWSAFVSKILLFQILFVDDFGPPPHPLTVAKQSIHQEGQYYLHFPLLQGVWFTQLITFCTLTWFARSLNKA